MGALPFSSTALPASCPQIYVAFCSQSENSTDFSNWLMRFDPCNNMWSCVSSIPGLVKNHVLKDFAMISISDSIYLIGGRVYRKEKSSQCDSNSVDDYIEVEVEVLSKVLSYNLISGQWSTCASLSMPRCNFACTVLDGKIYVAGGQFEASSARSTSSVEVYDPSNNQWAQLPDMKRLRYKCVGVTWKGKVHVIGGFVEGCDSDHFMDYVERCSAEVYNEEEGRWDLVAGMWRLDVPPNQIVEMGGTLFSSGDCFNSWKGHLEFYDEKLKLWNEVEGSQMTTPLCPMVGDKDNCCKSLRRLYITIASIGSYLYFLTGYKVFGDVSRSSTTSIIHRFDTTAQEDAWMSFEPSQEEGTREFCAHCCVVTH